MVFTTSNNNVSIRVEDISFMKEQNLSVYMKNGICIVLETYDDYDKLHSYFTGKAYR